MDYVLTGTVQSVADRLRVSVQLLRRRRGHAVGSALRSGPPGSAHPAGLDRRAGERSAGGAAERRRAGAAVSPLHRQRGGLRVVPARAGGAGADLGAGDPGGHRVLRARPRARFDVRAGPGRIGDGQRRHAPALRRRRRGKAVGRAGRARSGARAGAGSRPGGSAPRPRGRGAKGRLRLGADPGGERQGARPQSQSRPRALFQGRGLLSPGAAGARTRGGRAGASGRPAESPRAAADHRRGGAAGGPERRGRSESGGGTPGQQPGVRRFLPEAGLLLRGRHHPGLPRFWTPFRGPLPLPPRPAPPPRWRASPPSAATAPGPSG